MVKITHFIEAESGSTTCAPCKLFYPYIKGFLDEQICPLFGVIEIKLDTNTNTRKVFRHPDCIQAEMRART